MLIDTFRTYRTESLLKLPLWGLFLWAFAFTVSGLFYYDPVSPLYDAIAAYVSRYIWINRTLAFLLVLASAYLLGYMLNRHQLLPSKSYLPSFFYVLFMSYKPALLEFNKFILLNLIYMLIFDQLFRTYKKESADRNIFNAAFLAGLTGLIFLPSSVCILLVFIALVILRTPSLREMLVALIAFLVPFIYFLSYYFLTDRFMLVSYIIREELSFKGFTYLFTGSIEAYIEFAFWGLFIIALLYYLFRRSVQLLIVQYTNSIVILFTLFAALIGYAFEAQACFADFAIPASLLLSHLTLQLKKTGFLEFLIWCIVAMIAAGYFEEQIFVFLNLK
ncbi:MAG: hypothetical protein AB1458_03065 [Bacteroidota bacterium]